MTPHPELTPDEVAELLGAYALDACTPDETAAIEAVLAEQPDLADEAMRLRRAASWIGATETLVPPASLRDRVLRVRAVSACAAPGRRPARHVPLVVGDHGVGDRELPEAALDDTTTNGLSAHDLVVHMAAQESLLAQEAGTPVLPDLDETDIDARTAALLPSFNDRSVAAAAELWQQAVATNRDWALDNVGGNVTWRGLPMIARRRDRDPCVRDVDPHRRPPPRRRLGPRAARAGRAVGDVGARVAHPADCVVAPRLRAPRPRPRASCSPAPVAATGSSPLGAERHTDEAAPDVTLTADVVDWCRLVGDRVAPDELRYEFDGDGGLARDLVAAAPALATL